MTDLFSVLELTENLPSEDALNRWLGEPIKAVIIPTSIFGTNKSGFPILNKAHQNFLNKLFKVNFSIFYLKIWDKLMREKHVVSK